MCYEQKEEEINYGKGISITAYMGFILSFKQFHIKHNLNKSRCSLRVWTNQPTLFIKIWIIEYILTRKVIGLK